jgi:hypothetical protein
MEVLEINNTVSEMENSFGRLISRLHTTEEGIVKEADR